jgi:hypothetical protein
VSGLQSVEPMRGHLGQLNCVHRHRNACMDRFQRIAPTLSTRNATWPSQLAASIIVKKRRSEGQLGTFQLSQKAEKRSTAQPTPRRRT